MKVVVTAVGAVTGLGDLEKTWQGLLAGETALAPLNEAESLAHWPVGRIADLDGDLGSKRRLDNLLDMALHGVPKLPPETVLVASTTKAAVDELLENPAGPWEGQPWNLADELADRLGLSGERLTVSSACASGSLAIISAAQRLVMGECGVALVVGVDLLSRFVISGFAKLHALSDEPCRPFDQDRKGLSLGEAAGYVVLVSEDEAVSRKWPVLARLAGWGTACDAKHITAPCREASGLIAAINQATDNGRLQVGGINAHGTGTMFNDAMEMRGFSTLWPDDSPPFHSIKGSVGHTLGAAGVIETAVAVKSLAAGLLPPTIGLKNSDAVNAIYGNPVPLLYSSILSCNSGFGGINACVLLENVKAPF